MFRPAPALLVPLLSLVLAACGGSCGRGGARDGGAAARPEAPAPEGLLVDVAADDLGAFLGAARASVESPMAREVLPADAASLLDRFTETPVALRRHVPANARIRMLLVRTNDVTRAAMAVRATVENDPARPLGPEIALVNGAPHDARWVLGRPATDAPAIAFRDGVLVVADDERTLAATLPYLLDTQMRRDVGRGLHLHIPEGVLATKIRPLLDLSLERASRDLIVAARAERMQHEEAPALGEPERLVALVRDPLRRWIAYLPDAREVFVDLDATPAGLVLEARVGVKPGTPLADALAGSTVGAPFGLGALPVGTAFAVSQRRSDADAPVVELLADLAGSRLGAEDRAALEGASRTLDTARGTASVTALGATDQGAFLLFGAEPGAAELSPEALRSALRVPYVSGAIGSVVGCEGAIDVASAADAPTFPLCRRREPPYPALGTARTERGVAVAITQLPASEAAHPAPTTFAHALPRGGRGSIGADPDVARALGTFGDKAIVAVLVAPQRIVPALGFFGSPILRRLSRAAVPAGEDAPLVLAVSRDGTGLRLQALAMPHSIDQLTDVISLFSTLWSAVP
ncbi:MAG: hypothetical protein U0230_26745 [Polyangiales bacterium]